MIPTQILIATGIILVGALPMIILVIVELYMHLKYNL